MALTEDGGKGKTRMIRARIPEPNKNVTMAMGNKVIVDAVFSGTGLNDFLDGLKREQGDRVSHEAISLVSNCAEMTGISINRLDRMLENADIRKEYGLNGDARSIYRTVERLGRNSDTIVRFLGSVVKEQYDVTMETIFMDWTSMYFEASPNDVIRFGYSRDHRPDRPQVNVGLSIDKCSGMPIGLTVMPGNVLDVTHFSESLKQIRPLLPDDPTIILDAGAYSKENGALLDREGIGFVTRVQLNGSDQKHVKNRPNGWTGLDDDISYMRIDGNLGRKRYVFMSAKRKEEIFSGYRRKAERDYGEMQEIRTSVEKERKPRKKHSNSNCFVDTRLFYRFPLHGVPREQAVERAIRSMITGKEGLFVLLTNRELTASDVLKMYRSRNAVETAFKDLKHGISWRPARCTSPDAVKGRILISFLSLFVISMIRFLYPEYRTKTAESISEELSSFSLTVVVTDDGTKKRIWSNFTSLIIHIYAEKRPVRVPQAPEQASLETFG